ncbi:hypothetical protein [Terrihalobacillus insolitus]|uniref:hypothetical protein n=1 Tax=Terrihalobacillus insolitus TaxID=2950438 RepID=UPI0023419C9A|nr:hypothetical protein [Terrihalobacillus insolitus]MDC3412957.1 hypothetical protein [Terrihalobacillus insolitus]
MELLLTLIALFTGGAIPIFWLVLGADYARRKGFQNPMQRFNLIHDYMKGYMKYLLIPALIVLVLIWIYSAQAYPDLANRIWAGIWIGVLSSIALDIVRLIGVKLGWMPMDMPPVFGIMIAGPKASSATHLWVGYLYHFLNGIDFAIVYTLVVGPGEWWWGVIWALLVELGMMLLVPVLMPGHTVFGFNKGIGIFGVSLVAHIAMGLVIGFLAQAFVNGDYTIFSLIENL